MLYSGRCEYAVRALTYLAQQPANGFTLLAKITEAEDLPRAFAGKILQDLVRAGLLRSARGPTGGYALALPSADISLLQIVQSIDGTADLDRCAVGLNPCSDDMPCPLHDTWKPLRTEIKQYLEETTLLDLAAGVSRKRKLIEQAKVTNGV
jgi:Rrf2 family protein